MATGITAHLVVRNEALVYYAIKSIYPLCDQILVDDTGSTDSTLVDIADALREDTEHKIVFKKTPIATNELGWTATTWINEQKKNKGKFGVGAVRAQQLARTKTPYFLIVDGDETYYRSSFDSILHTTKNWPADKICGRVGIRWMLDNNRYFVTFNEVGRLFLTAKTAIGVVDSPGEMATVRGTKKVICTESPECFSIPNTMYLHWEKMLKPWRRLVNYKKVKPLTVDLPEVIRENPKYLERYLETAGRHPKMRWVPAPPRYEDYMKGLTDACGELRLSPAGLTLLHVGAHHGQEDPYYAKCGFVPSYVEPNPAAFKKLQAACPGRKCWNLAASTREGKVNFHLYTPDECSSFFERSPAFLKLHPNVKKVSTTSLPCARIDTLVKQIGKPVDILVIDTQGAELQVLSGASEILKTAKIVQCELYHDQFYAGCAKSYDVDKFMAKRGFIKFWEAPGSEDCWGDAIYIKRA